MNALCIALSPIRGVLQGFGLTEASFNDANDPKGFMRQMFKETGFLKSFAYNLRYGYQPFAEGVAKLEKQRGTKIYLNSKVITVKSLKNGKYLVIIEKINYHNFTFHRNDEQYPDTDRRDFWKQRQKFMHPKKRINGFRGRRGGRNRGGHRETPQRRQHRRQYRRMIFDVLFFSIRPIDAEKILRKSAKQV